MVGVRASRPVTRTSGETGGGKVLHSRGGGFAVNAGELPMEPGQGGRLRRRTPVGRHVGCRNLTQRVLEILPGRTINPGHGASEEVLYVVRGAGELLLDGRSHRLMADTGALVPAGRAFEIVNPGPEELVVVSVVSPQPGRPAPPAAEARLRPDGKLTVHMSEEASIPAGDDRTFKLLIDPRYGCRYMTQFVGFIQKSRAPFHTHTYEEAIYILEGAALVHMDDERYRVEAGGSVYLPPGLPHCLENAQPETLRLLGVFCPAGDPGSRREDESGA